jgi:hypothetical protein
MMMKPISDFVVVNYRKRRVGMSAYGLLAIEYIAKDCKKR